MLARFFIVLIRLYQRLLSPLLGNVCRFEPSCSRYAVTCLDRFGAARGTWLAAARLCKCHPFHPGGYDPPPALTPPPGAQASPEAAHAPPSNERRTQAPPIVYPDAAPDACGAR